MARERTKRSLLVYSDRLPPFHSRITFSHIPETVIQMPLWTGLLQFPCLIQHALQQGHGAFPKTPRLLKTLRMAEIGIVFPTQA
jgi:hypothetical protein